MERFDLFRSKTLEVEKVEQSGGEFRFQLLMEGERSGRGEFVEFLLESVPDALDSFKFSLTGESDDVAGKLGHGLGSGPVGPDLERILPLQFEEQGDLFERVGKGFAGHGAMRLGLDGSFRQSFPEVEWDTGREEKEIFQR